MLNFWIGSGPTFSTVSKLPRHNGPPCSAVRFLYLFSAHPAYNFVVHVCNIYVAYSIMMAAFMFMHTWLVKKNH